METKKVLTRENQPTDQLHESVTRSYKGLDLTYTEVYYLDSEVDDETGVINKDKIVKHYTKDQMNRNLKALKSAYLIAKGAASPDEIIEFRVKYKIAASTLSKILGFSKNTISNIENDGVTSLPSGRLIKVCLNNRKIMYRYITLCDSIEIQKKKELSTRIMQEEV